MPAREARQALPAEALEPAPPAAVLPGMAGPFEPYEEPMPENAYQERVIWEVASGLRLHFLDGADVLIASNLFVKYALDGMLGQVAPDVFVALGVAGHARRSFDIREEGRPPDFVLEVASPGTVDADIGEKRGLYARLGVREYFQFDPEPDGGLLVPRLQGRRLQGAAYAVVGPAWTAGERMSIRSDVLALEFHADGQRLRVWDPAGERYLSTGDEARARRRAEDRARDEARARRQAEDRAREGARALQQAEDRARDEARARRQAEDRARKEAMARRRLEAQLAELRAAGSAKDREDS